MARSISIFRVMLALAGATAMAWAIVVFPVFRFEIAVNDVARGIVADEAYNPDVLTAVAALTDVNSNLMRRSSMLSKAAVIRLRQAEDAIHLGNAPLIEKSLKSSEDIVHKALRNAPNDSFLWLVLFSLGSRRDGVRPDNLRFLRMSYQLGPNEGWIIVRRSRIVLSNYPSLPNDLAEKAISDFVSLVRWGLVPQATEIASGPAESIRSILFARLRNLNDQQRHAFAAAMYRLGLDDVTVPGIEPPPSPIPLPALPPKF